MSHPHILPFFSGGPVVVGTGPAKPRVLYNNLMRMGAPTAIIATSEPDPTNYAKQRCFDDRPYTYYAVDAGTQYLEFRFASAKRVTAYGIYSTTLSDAGASATLEYSTNSGGSWHEYHDPEAPVDTAPIYRYGAPIDASRWRWKFVSSVPLYIGCLAFGEDFEFERGTWVGFSPPKLARATDLTNNVSHGGVWLGRSIIRNGAAFGFDLDKLTAAWVNTVWYPFILHAERRPWWLLWEWKSHPAEAAFCWSEGAIPKPSNSHPNFMRASMKVSARTDAV